MLDKQLTLAEAAKALGVTRQAVYQYAMREGIPVGEEGVYRVRLRDLQGMRVPLRSALDIANDWLGECLGRVGHG